MSENKKANTEVRKTPMVGHTIILMAKTIAEMYEDNAALVKINEKLTKELAEWKDDCDSNS